MALLLGDDYTDAVFAVGNSNPEERNFLKWDVARSTTAHASAASSSRIFNCASAETMMGCILRMTNEHAIMFIQVVLGIIMLYCGCPDIIWDIMTTMRIVKSKRIIKAYAVDMGIRVRQLQPGELKKSRYCGHRQQRVRTRGRHGVWSVERRQLFLQTVNSYWTPIAETRTLPWFRGATNPGKLEKHITSSRQSRSQV